MKLIEWSKIDNDKTFQKLVNDVFSLEINHPGFIFSNPYIGKDGGWDGMYKGKYMEIDGTWSFQSKYTKNNGIEACRSLKSQIIKELEKSKTNKVDNLILLTNADLTVDQVNELILLNTGYVKNFFIWPKENLDSKIKDYPWIRHRYFNDVQQPAFAPFINIDNDDYNHVEIETKREQEEKMFSDFLLDDKKILIIHASGGCGKTYFINQIFKKYSNNTNEYNFLYYIPGIRDVDDALNDELDISKNVIIFLDDSERYIEDVTKKLLSRVNSYSPGKIKIVLITRTSGKSIIIDIINSLGIAIDKYEEIELQKLPNDSLIKILNFFAKKNVSNSEEILNEVSSNLFLLISIGKLISKNKGKVNVKSIKNKIKYDLEKDVCDSLKIFSLSDQKIKELLFELAILIPFNDDNLDILEKISNKLSLNQSDIKKYIQKLKTDKILINIGYSIRFYSDMVGDVYLSVIFDSDDGTLIKNILNSWFEVFPEKIISNISSAVKHSDGDFNKDPIRNTIKEISINSTKLDDFNKINKLKTFSQIAYIIPDEIIDLIYCFLQTSEKITTDDCGPIIINLLYLQEESIRKKLIELILFVSDKNIEGKYQNYKIETLAKRFVSPIYNTLECATSSLNLVSNISKKQNLTNSEIKIIKYSLEESLSSSHDYEESYGIKMTFSKKILNYKNEVKEKIDIYRDLAMNTLHECLKNNDDDIKNEFIDLISDIGNGETSKNYSIWDRIILDKEKTIDFIEEILKTPTNNKIIASLEDILIREWSNNNIYKDGTNNKISKILINFPRNPEYIIFKNFISKDIIIYDFKNIEEIAPDKDRWSWIIDNYFRNEDIKMDEFEKTVEEISKKYNKKEDIISYLISLYKDVKDNLTWQYIPLIETWSKYNKSVFIEIINDETLLNKLPIIFNLGIYIVAADDDEKYITSLANKILNDDIKNINIQYLYNLLNLIDRHKISNKIFIPWILEIIKNSNLSAQSGILHRSYFIFKDRSEEDKKEVFKIMDCVLDNIKDPRVLDMFEFLLHSSKTWNIEEDELETLRNKLTNIIKDLHNIEHHSNELLTFSINNNMDKFIDFLEYRLLKHKEFVEKNDYSFDAIPYEGFRLLKNIISNYNDFYNLILKTNSWIKDNLFYPFELDNLLKELENCDTYIDEFIEKNINSNDKKIFSILINFLYSIDFTEKSSIIFLNTLINSQNLGLIDEAKNLFIHKVLSGSYSSSIGEAPPALVNKKNILYKLEKECPNGIIKVFISSIKDSIEKQIEDNIKEGQELINPK